MTGDLFGEPERDFTDKSQFFTPAAIARRMASWIPPTATVLEPSAGRGNLIEPLITRGHDPRKIVAVERDARWCAVLASRFPDIRILCANFEELDMLTSFDFALMNPPFEREQHARHLAKALEVAPQVVILAPSSIEFGAERDRTLWSQRARVWKRARLPSRVQYGGEHSASFDSVVLAVKRRDRPREQGELVAVTEEVWT